ncbi:hypothetical protein PMAYCL1PPCAC_13927, partial [Pristionchus mayeri]
DEEPLICELMGLKDYTNDVHPSLLDDNKAVDEIDKMSTIATFTVPCENNMRDEVKIEPEDNTLMESKDKPIEMPQSTLRKNQMEPKEKQIEVNDKLNNNKNSDGVDVSANDGGMLNDGMVYSDTAQVEKGRRTAIDLEDYMDGSMDSMDEEFRPSVKKSRSDAAGEINKINLAKKKIHVSKKSDRKMNCPECEFGTHCCSTWIAHLRAKHSTYPKIAGYLLRCDCGQESYANSHSYQCDIYNITVVQEEDNVIRRLIDCMVDNVAGVSNDEKCAVSNLAENREMKRSRRTKNLRYSSMEDSNEG